MATDAYEVKYCFESLVSRWRDTKAQVSSYEVSIGDDSNITIKTTRHDGKVLVSGPRLVRRVGRWIVWGRQYWLSELDSRSLKWGHRAFTNPVPNKGRQALVPPLEGSAVQFRYPILTRTWLSPNDATGVNIPAHQTRSDKNQAIMPSGADRHLGVMDGHLVRRGLRLRVAPSADQGLEAVLHLVHSAAARLACRPFAEGLCLSGLEPEWLRDLTVEAEVLVPPSPLPLPSLSPPSPRPLPGLIVCASEPTLSE